MDGFNMGLALSLDQHALLNFPNNVKFSCLKAEKNAVYIDKKNYHNLSCIYHVFK